MNLHKKSIKIGYLNVVPHVEKVSDSEWLQSMENGDSQVQSPA